VEVEEVVLVLEPEPGRLEALVAVEEVVLELEQEPTLE